MPPARVVYGNYQYVLPSYLNSTYRLKPPAKPTTTPLVSTPTPPS
jgi:hypothetical protein